MSLHKFGSYGVRPYSHDGGITLSTWMYIDKPFLLVDWMPLYSITDSASRVRIGFVKCVPGLILDSDGQTVDRSQMVYSGLPEDLPYTDFQLYRPGLYRVFFFTADTSV